jgi:two-component sensor histidine kinase/PAS domain-containing protein
MLTRRFAVRLQRKASPADYLAALALSAVAVFLRAVLGRFDHGVAPYLVLFPAVILQAVFFGTGPALAAALAGWVATSMLLFGATLYAPPLTAPQIASIAFWPAGLTVIWAASLLRQIAGEAAMAEARLEEVFRQIPGAAAIIEAPDGRLLLRSTQSNAVLGQPERSLQTVQDMGQYGGLHPDGRVYAPGDYPIVRALRDGAVIRGETLRYRRPDGAVADLEVHAGPVRADDGSVVAAIGMAFDVSERALSQRQLQESEVRYRTLAERLGAAVDVGEIGLWEMDLATQHFRMDARYAAMLGLPAEPAEFQRLEFDRFAEPEEFARASAVFDAAVAAGGIYADELQLRTMQGQARWFVARGAVLSDAQRVIGVVRDVTDRRQREEALRAALDERDVLMREADHRIKNSLQLVVSLLRLQIGQVREPEAKDALRAAVARVEAVAEAHLALQRSPDLKQLDLGQILRDLAQRLGLLNPAITVSCDAEAGLMLDAEQAVPLGLIASELVTNAMRHAFPHRAAGTVGLSAVRQGATLTMTVADDGVGMAVAERPSGLGTTVITALARQTGATVERRNTPGGGMAVTLTVPLGVRKA